MVEVIVNQFMIECYILRIQSLINQIRYLVTYIIRYHKYPRHNQTVYRCPNQSNFNLNLKSHFPTKTKDI